MTALKKINFLLAAFLFSSLLIINSCGDKGGDPPPPPPNPCASKTITVAATVVNTTTGQAAGSITATGAGSTNFTYQLNTGAFQTSGTFTALAAGTYTITAKDAEGCTGSASFTVNDPCTAKSITVSGTVTNAGLGLANGAISATAAGSTGFTYQLNTGSFQASGNFTGLAVGTYTVTAKDADGCTKSQTFTVADICAAKAITITGVIVNPGPASTATNGSITATAAGSTGFTYQIGTSAFQASGTFSGLGAGLYNITAKDADGCTKTQSFTLTADACIGKTLTISAATTGTDKCATTGTGTITITGGGGTGFTYQLGTGAFQAANIFTGLAANTYNIAVKDGDGCIKTGTATVNQAAGGALFGAVKSVLQSNCALSGCHAGSSPAGGLNFTVDCTIVNSWDRIKARAVDGSPSFMPPSGPQLSAADKQKITDWIAAGHKFTD
jgi:hypothetical protein